MMTTNEEKRWLVVGLVINKVVAPVLQEYIKHGMDTHYTNLDTYCSRLAPPCTLTTLTYHQVKADGILKKLKFQNINNNPPSYGKVISPLYNYSINDSVQLAKLYLPDYLAKFSAFDESLDISAMLRLLEFSKCTPIFPSPNPFIPIQSSADDVRDNVRNKWGHCKPSDWTETFFKDCFSKLETLVKSLGLSGGKEKTVLDELSDWQTKGCQLCMGHAVDQQLLSLVQQDVKDLSANYVKTQAELSTLQELVAGQTTERFEMQGSISLLRDEHAATQAHQQEHEEQIGEMKKWVEQQGKETKEVLEKLQAVEKSLMEELCGRVQQAETRLAESDEKLQQLESDLCDTNVKLLQLQGERLSVEGFDVETCRSKLAQHYRRTATVPTSVWSKKSPVDMQKIYTRLTWVKLEQTPEGSSNPALSHYTEVFDKNENGYVPNRILVQGETGIGKTTFVKKMGLDWAELVDETTIDKQCQDAGTSFKAEGSVTLGIETEPPKEEYIKESATDANALKRFELVLIINLKEVSKYPSLRDVICHSNIFPEEDKTMAEELLNYITKNQAKVLLVFDGYDEYRCRMNSDIYEIFKGHKLRNCCVLITTRITEADDLREFKDAHAEITGFNRNEEMAFMCKMLGGETEAMELWLHLANKGLFGLARVPLLLLFFCTLWKKGKLNSFPETKTKLYYAIVQYVLDHNHGKGSPARFQKVDKYKDILVEIGKVALECLLRDDHVFEFDQLSASIAGEESHIIGLLQVTEFSENLRPAGMVSFIHKSIQEFLAAWYITFRCVPEGNLGKIRDEACTLKGCQSLENVFQFICGLSDAGAVKVFEHLAAVRIANSDLDLSKIFADLVNERDLAHPCIEALSEIACKSFQEVESKPQVLNHFFDSTGRIVLVTRQVTELLKKMKLKHSTKPLQSDVVFLARNNDWKECQILQELAECLECLHIPLKTSETSTLKEFLVHFQKEGEPFPHIPLNTSKTCKPEDFFEREVEAGRGKCHCNFTSILHFCDDQFQFYVTSFRTECLGHISLFTATDSTYKFLNSITFESLHDPICDILESIPSPNKCTLTIRNISGSRLSLTSARKIGNLFPRFSNNSRLNLGFSHSSATEVEALVTGVTVKLLEGLILVLTPADAAALSRLLPEMSSVENLTFVGKHESVWQDEEMEALFGGFNRRLPKLRQLYFGHFNIRVSLYPFLKILQFFPNLQCLKLVDINLNEPDLCQLLRNLEFIPSLEELTVEGKRQRYPDSCVASCSEEVDIQAGFIHRALKSLDLREIKLTPAAAALLGRLIPKMPSIEKLAFTWGTENIRGLSSGKSSERLQSTSKDESILEAGQVKALFGRVNRPLPLRDLTFGGFTVKGCLAPLAESFQFFPHLQTAKLNFEFIMNDNFFLDFLEKFKYISHFLISVQCEAVTNAGSAEEENTMGRLEMQYGDLRLYDITLTPRAASALGRSFPEMTTLQRFVFTAKDGNALEGKIMEKLFGQCRKELPLRELILKEIVLTPEAAAALGRLIPGLSSLIKLELCGVKGSVLSAKEMEALFGELNKTLPLEELSLKFFRVTGCLSAISKCLRFLPDLQQLTIGEVTMDEHNVFHLLSGLKHVPRLQKLTVEGKSLGCSNLCSEKLATDVSFSLDALQSVVLGGLSLTPEAAAALGGLLPGMSSLKFLALSGMDETFLDEVEIDSLFERIDQTSLLESLHISGFRVRSSLAPLTDHLRFISKTTNVTLDIYISNSDFDLCGFLDNNFLLSGLRSLRFFCNTSNPKVCKEKVNRMSRLTLCKYDLTLLDINLTSAVASAIARASSKISTLDALWLVTREETVLNDEEVNALFSGFQETLSLERLFFIGLRVRGCLAPLAKSFVCFPNLRSVNLDIAFNSDDLQNLRDFLESLRFMTYFNSLKVQFEVMACPNGTDEANTEGRVRALDAYEEISLSGITLTPATAAALGHSLSEMSSLKSLRLIGGDGCILTAEEIEALLGGFKENSPLQYFELSGFFVRGFSSPLANSLSFFTDLRRVSLNVSFQSDDVQNVCGFLESLGFVKYVNSLSLRCEVVAVPDGDEANAVGRLTTGCIFQEISLSGSCFFQEISLSGITLTPAAAAALGQSLGRMSKLRNLKLTGGYGCIINAKEIDALFSGFLENSPLQSLSFSGFNVGGFLAPLPECFSFFPDFHIENLDVTFSLDDEQNVCDFFKSLRFMKRVTSLLVECEAECEEVAILYGMGEVTIEGQGHSSQWGFSRQISLKGITLTSEAAAALGQSLCEMSSLKALELTARNGSIMNADELEALFGGFQGTHLSRLTFRGFRMRGCRALLAKGFNFFLDFHVKDLYIAFSFNDPQNVCDFLESLRFMKSFNYLSIKCEAVACSDTTDEVNTEVRLRKSEFSRGVSMSGVTLTTAAAAVFGQSLCEMSSLETLELIGRDGCILDGEQIEALFGGFQETLPLSSLTLRDFSLRGCLAPLAKSFRFFPCLDTVTLLFYFNSGDLQIVGGFLENFRVMKCFNALHIQCKEIACPDDMDEVNSVSCLASPFFCQSIILKEIPLTPVAAAVLGRSLWEISSLEGLFVTGGDGCALNAVEVEALFSGLNKPMPLSELEFGAFNVQGHLTSFISSLKFFPDLTWLSLSKLNMSEYDLKSLLESFEFIPSLRVLDLSHNPLGHAVKSIVPEIIKFSNLRVIDLSQTASTEDLTYVRETIQRLQPQLRVCFEEEA